MAGITRRALLVMNSSSRFTTDGITFFRAAPTCGDGQPVCFTETHAKSVMSRTSSWFR